MKHYFILTILIGFYSTFAAAQKSEGLIPIKYRYPIDEIKNGILKTFKNDLDSSQISKETVELINKDESPYICNLKFDIEGNLTDSIIKDLKYNGIKVFTYVFDNSKPPLEGIPKTELKIAPETNQKVLYTNISFSSEVTNIYFNSSEMILGDTILLWMGAQVSGIITESNLSITFYPKAGIQVLGKTYLITRSIYCENLGLMHYQTEFEGKMLSWTVESIEELKKN